MKDGEPWVFSKGFTWTYFEDIAVVGSGGGGVVSREYHLGFPKIYSLPKVCIDIVERINDGFTVSSVSSRKEGEVICVE